MTLIIALLATLATRGDSWASLRESIGGWPDGMGHFQLELQRQRTALKDDAFVMRSVGPIRSIQSDVAFAPGFLEPETLKLQFSQGKYHATARFFNPSVQGQVYSGECTPYAFEVAYDGERLFYGSLPEMAGEERVLFVDNAKFEQTTNPKEERFDASLLEDLGIWFPTRQQDLGATRSRHLLTKFIDDGAELLQARQEAESWVVEFAMGSSSYSMELLADRSYAMQRLAKHVNGKTAWSIQVAQWLPGETSFPTLARKLYYQFDGLPETPLEEPFLEEVITVQSFLAQPVNASVFVPVLAEPGTLVMKTDESGKLAFRVSADQPYLEEQVAGVVPMVPATSHSWTRELFFLLSLTAGGFVAWRSRPRNST